MNNFFFVKPCLKNFDHDEWPNITSDMITFSGTIRKFQYSGELIRDHRWGWNRKWIVILDTKEKFEEYNKLAKNKDKYRWEDA